MGFGEFRNIDRIDIDKIRKQEGNDFYSGKNTNEDKNKLEDVEKIIEASKELNDILDSISYSTLEKTKAVLNRSEDPSDETALSSKIETESFKKREEFANMKNNPDSNISNIKRNLAKLKGIKLLTGKEKEEFKLKSLRGENRLGSGYRS